MMSALEIRDLLQTALAEVLGVYRFGNLETPAIRIDDGGQPGPVDGVAIGLEVVIATQLETTLTPLLGGSFQQLWTTAIALKQWDTEGTTLPALVAALQALRSVPVLDVSGPIARQVRNSNLDNIERSLITVRQTELLSIE
jgi:hypothetical protein